MKKLLLLIFSTLNFFNPLSKSTLKFNKNTHSSSIAMISSSDKKNYKECGNIVSTMINSAATSSENCRQSIQTEIHRDGSTTDHITMTCNKKIKKDKDGNLIKKTNTTKPKFKKAKEMFFEDSNKNMNSSNKEKK